VIITCSGCNSRYDVTGRRAGTRARCRCGTVLCIPKSIDSAEMLHCPGCGAPTSPDDVSCSYCKAVLAVVACPSCFGRVFVGSKHCQHCGAEMLLPAQGDLETSSHRKCPRCTSNVAQENKPSELVAHLLNETLLDECGVCGGVWLEAAAFEKLIKSRDEQATVLSGGGPYLELEAYSQRTLETPRYLPCPDCGQLMNRKNFADASGVIVDVCKPHGLWFDRDELGRIIQFVMKGGLDESRRRELERLESKMSEKRAEVVGLSLTPMHDVRTRYDGEWLDGLLHVLRDFFR
jgi:Zn-finger nucleic acid-binding protein